MNTRVDQNEPFLAGKGPSSTGVHIVEVPCDGEAVLGFLGGHKKSQNLVL
jgi:hypothetical protein